MIDTNLTALPAGLQALKDQARETIRRREEGQRRAQQEAADRSWAELLACLRESLGGDLLGYADLARPERFSDASYQFETVVRLPGHYPIEALFGKGAHWRRSPYDAHPADHEPGGGRESYWRVRRPRGSVCTATLGAALYYAEVSGQEASAAEVADDIPF
jgi:hypothetical protein